MSTEQTDYLRKYGNKVTRNGWPMVLLKRGEKKPLAKFNKQTNKVEGWLEVAPKRPDLVDRFLERDRKYGIGIKCGNIIGLDDDYEEGGPVTKDFLKAVKELKAHFFPYALKRKGRSSRVPLQVFPLEDNEVFKSMDVGKFQVIGKGRQFVAYNRHPDGHDYKWTTDGSPASVKLSDVPEYSRKDLEDFLRAVQLLEETWGVDPGKSRDVMEKIKSGEYKSAVDLTCDEETLRQVAQYLEDKAEWGWDDWVNKLMMPLWAASEGADWGLEIAHQVSSQHETYDFDATEKKWEQLSSSKPDRIGIGTLMWQARQNGMPYLGPQTWEDYRHFRDRDSLLNIKTHIWTTNVGFNNLFHEHKEKGSTPLQTFIQIRPNAVYDTIIWDPSLPYGAASMEGRTVWNTCIMPKVPEDQGDVEPWLELVHNIYGKHSDIIIKRMAFDVQYPERKPQWHELIIGEHGIGKNTNKTPLRLWFGSMGRSLNAEKLEGSFNSYMVNVKHLEIEEVAALGNKTFNKLKNMFASADPYYEVNEKYTKPYLVRNVASIPMSSNEIDAISLAHSERRIFVVRHRGKPLPEKKRIWLHNDWIPANWKKVINYLSQVELPKGFGESLPYRTEDMKELVQTAGRAHDKLFTLVLDAVKGVEVFTLEDLHQHFVSSDVCEKPGVHVSKETLRKAMLTAGAVKAYKGMPIRLDGDTQHRLWSLNKETVEASADEVRLLWQISEKFKQIVTD